MGCTDSTPLIHEEGMHVEVSVEKKTTIQVAESTRDRLYRLKFRKTYNDFLNELCDLYESDINLDD